VLYEVSEVNVLVLEFHRAFDKVPRGRLLAKLKVWQVKYLH
jgi:hypothetical protein